MWVLRFTCQGFSHTLNHSCPTLASELDLISATENTQTVRCPSSSSQKLKTQRRSLPPLRVEDSPQEAAENRNRGVEFLHICHHTQRPSRLQSERSEGARGAKRKVCA